MTPGGGAKSNTALAHSCHVLIITIKFGEFLLNFLGDGVTDGADYNIPQFFFQKAWRLKNLVFVNEPFGLILFVKLLYCHIG